MKLFPVKSSDGSYCVRRGQGRGEAMARRLARIGLLAVDDGIVDVRPAFNL